MNKQEKVNLVEELKGSMVQAPAVVLAESVGMPVNKVNELRARLRAQGAAYRIVKNTLARRAVSGTDLERLSDLFVGPTGVAYHPEDATIAAKIVVEFAKDHDRFTVKAGYLNGAILDEKGVEALSKMPGKDELRADLLRVLNGVGTKFVRVLAAGPTSFLNVLNARRDSLGA